MKIKDLLAKLASFDPEGEVLVFDEALDGSVEIEQVAEGIKDDPPNSAVIYLKN